MFSWLSKSQDHLPLTWWKQHPVYLSAVLALAGALSMVLYAVLGRGLMGYLAFSVDAVVREWRFWTPLTYVVVNPPSFWILIGCYLLWSFGEAVERHFGRRAYVRLLVVLLVCSPLLITLMHLMGARGMGSAGLTQLQFGVFIAFATLYPKAKISLIIVSIDAWMLAAAFVGINALQCLALRDFVSLLLLAGNVGAAFVFVRLENGEWKLPSLRKPLAGPAKPSKSPKTGKSTAKPAGSAEPSADDILDKISREGIHSLTAKERRILQKASEAMKKRK